MKNNSYMELDRDYAEDYDKFIEFFTIYHSVTKDLKLLEQEILLSPKNRPIDFISAVDGINYFIEVKGRNNTSVKYSDGNILEVSKLESFYKKVSEHMNFDYTGDNYIELLKLCKESNNKLYYYNYFTDDILYIWDIADVILKENYTKGSHFAPRASTKGFNGYNYSTNKKTILLKNENAFRTIENLFGKRKDDNFKLFRHYVQTLRNRFENKK